jgi:hypothetical protein
MFALRNEKVRTYDRMWFLLTFSSISIVLLTVLVILFSSVN